MFVKYTREKWVTTQCSWVPKVGYMTLGPSLSLFFFPHSICLGWFTLEVEPKIQVIYLGSDIKKQRTEMRRKS